MDAGIRSAGSSGVVVKNRNSSGCLIVKKKKDGMGGGEVGSSSSRKMLQSKKKRASVVTSDSRSSDEQLLMPLRRGVAPETIRVCNGLTAFEKGIVEESSGIGRKRDRLEEVRRGRDGINGLDDRERKRSKLDVFEFDEYDGMNGDSMRRHQFEDTAVHFSGRRFTGSMHVAQIGIEREFEARSSRHILNKRKKSYYDSLSDPNIEDNVDHGRYKMKADGSNVPLVLLREKYTCHSDEPIRVQGKNGVLKVMVNKKKMGGPLDNFSKHKSVESRQSLRTEDAPKRNLLICPSSSSGSKRIEKPSLADKPEINKGSSRKSLCSENSDSSLKLGLKNAESQQSLKRVSSDDRQSPLNGKPTATKIKEGKVRRGSGTEKQKLREQLRQMLLDAGWTIDYRPRRNRDYLDAVYINPGGTAYWSIIKAYDALQKQLNDDNEAKPSRDVSSFARISDEVLSQLTRKTRKKIEKEMKQKQTDGSDTDSAKEDQVRRSASPKHDVDSMDSDCDEEKLSSFLRQGGKLLKNRMIENGVTGVNSRHLKSTHRINEGAEKPSYGCDSRLSHGRKSNKHGRCTLLIRNKGLNSENDGFVHFTGKRTVLSWLIDSGTVQLSQKVLYRRRKRVTLEGWITRDGIHCGCCSKILTVSKFEIHAGSKLRQPFQNIYLDTGFSLLQCQIDAWNGQDGSGQIGFHTVDVDGDDPNDDTCGICGDGGDLICCDGCPSTFHQSCLDIQMLPPGEWHCPNCICEFCGVGGEVVDEEDDPTSSSLLTCNLCEKKYHESCTKKMDALAADSNISCYSFCRKGCKELFEHLKKYLGAKHDLEGGFSWSLIHRMDDDLEAASRGISQRVECNSKLAVALSIMDECFLPVVDRRSGIHLIHNVLYNCGSNFSRLNYSGFYTAILERGDEIISAASIRFHGTKVAEMPFIGTRHIYRRQGMCRRLFSAIESALTSLKVEKLVIPAIAELLDTWTAVFGFTHVEEQLKKEMRSMNMLVFPGTDMLQKQLGVGGKPDGNVTTTGTKQMAEDKQHRKPDITHRSDMDSSVKQAPPHGYKGAASGQVNDINDEAVTSDSVSQNVEAHANDTSVFSSSLDVSHELNNSNLVEGNISSESQSGDKAAESAPNMECVSPTSINHGTPRIENKLVLDSQLNDNLQSLTQGPGSCREDMPLSGHSLDAPCNEKVLILVKEMACSDPHPDFNMVKCAYDHEGKSSSAMSHDAQEMESKLLLNSHEEIAQPSEEGVTDNHNEVLETFPPSGVSGEKVTEENPDVSNEVSSDDNIGVSETVPSCMELGESVANENVVVSGSNLNGSCQSSLQNGEIAPEEDKVECGL